MWADTYTTSTKRKMIGKQWQYIQYLDLPASLDIEVTSYGDEDNRVGIPYTAQICVNGVCSLVRTIPEMIEILKGLKAHYKLGYNRRLVVYVHNLAYEFQFFAPYLNILELFALDAHKPLTVLTDLGIELRCSYLLSGYKLETVGDHLLKYKVAKLVGGLDYSLPRSPETPLTDTEIQYCLDDVKVVVAYIQEEIESYGSIAQMVLTNTGRVRRYCTNTCLYGGEGSHKKEEAAKQREKYLGLMHRMTISPEEYEMLHAAFQGGFTHANSRLSTSLISDVTSYDFTSSYPAVMVAEKFPMGKGRWVDPKTPQEFEQYLKDYCCLIDLEYDHIESKYNVGDRPISVSHCARGLENLRADNGRIISADHVRTTITEQDYEIYKAAYEIGGEIKVHKMMIYPKEYLPTEYVMCILKLYADKTTLKGVKGREDDYLRGKGMLNSLYGMAVTNILRDETEYDPGTLEWGSNPPDIGAALDRYNKSQTRVNSYAWGVWVTAYARRNLWSGILECGDDYIYSDTDSLKIRNAEKHKAYFERYNREMIEKLKAACDYHKIGYEMIAPKTVKGVEKPLGVWDFDGHYDYFKTLGAKRYLTYGDDHITMTVAGCGVLGVKYMLDTCKVLAHWSEKTNEWIVDDPKNIKSVFGMFDDKLEIPADYAGRLIHSYISDRRRGTMIDYLGNSYKYDVPASIHLNPSAYTLSMAQDYMMLTDGNEFEI